MADQNSNVQIPTSNVVDGEIIENKSTEGASDLMTLTNLISNYLTQIDRQESELKQHKEMLEDAFNNDPTYREHADKVKEAMKVRNATKAQIMKQPAVMELSSKVKEMREGLKEAKEALSGYLQEYARVSGQQSFESPSGQVMQIVYTAKLVKIA